MPNIMLTNLYSISDKKMSNQEILWSFYKFKSGSPLQTYLQSKLPEKYNQTTFTLVHLLTDLRNILRKEVLYDTLNPAIILCDSDLESALECKGLHVTEVRERVLKHIICVKHPENKNNNTSKKRPYSETSDSSTMNTNKKKKLTETCENNFTLSPLLKEALTTVPFFPCDQPTFKYDEICDYVSRYILHKKENLLDPRNIKLCIVKNDPLGKAFNVNAFHRLQVTCLLKRNIFAAN